MSMSVLASVDLGGPKEAARSMDFESMEQAMEFIMELDLKQADAEFTITLINRLIESLQYDMEAEEVKNSLDLFCKEPVKG